MMRIEEAIARAKQQGKKVLKKDIAGRDCRMLPSRPGRYCSVLSIIFGLMKYYITKKSCLQIVQKGG